MSSAVSAVTYQTGVGVSFTFNPKLTLTLSSSNLVISNLAPGTSDNSNEIAITVSTNAAYGYNLSATVGNSTTYNNTDLTHTSGSSAGKFSSIAFQSNSSNYTSSFTTDNTWGYSIDSGTKYNGLPLYSDTTNIATLKSTDTTPATGTDTVNFLIGAKASTTQPTGDYKNVINFIAVTNPVPTLEPVACESGKICYNENSLDPVEGTMGKQSASANSSVTLLASNFSRAGYGFAGWSDVHDYDTNPNAHFYGPQETITTPSNMSAGLPLYAVWVESAGYMQTDATRVCNTLTTAPTDGTASLSSVSALTDQRDNQTYAIAKLADGKCWMIENLRLEYDGTDNTNGSLAQGYGGQFAGLAEPEAAWANNITTANSLYSTDGADNTINIGTSDASYRFPRYNNINTSSRASSPTTNSTAMYSYGNYYTWSAAIADTTAYTTNNQSVTGTSICPTGWHLPTGGLAYASGSTSGVNVTGDTNTFREFYNLGYKIMDEVKTANEDTPNNGYAYYSSNTTNTAGKTATAAFRSYPNNFVYSGDVYSGSVNARGSSGCYWSSTAISSNGAYCLSLNSSNVYPGTYNSNKYNGRSVRCVAPGV